MWLKRRWLTSCNPRVSLVAPCGERCNLGGAELERMSWSGAPVKGHPKFLFIYIVAMDKRKAYTPHYELPPRGGQKIACSR